MHGGVARGDLGKENVAAVRKGCENLARHIKNVKSFGVPCVVAINRFVADTDKELRAVRDTAKKLGADAILCNHWAEGSKGTEALAKQVVKLAESGKSKFKPIYPDDMPLLDKIETIAKKIYGAKGIAADDRVRGQLREWEAAGYGKFPVCIAKTQYSFSTDANLKGAPSGHIVPVREVRLSAGAEFIVAVTGDIMTMPGLPRVPAANSIKLNAGGQIEGLF
jgi:formate--tetrahydrofolate ligase